MNEKGSAARELSLRRLTRLSKTELIRRAEELGLDTDRCRTKTDIVECIANAEAGAVLPGAADSAEKTPEELTMTAKAKVILDKARAKGPEHAFLFETLFTQYVEALSHRQKLEAAIKEDGVIVKKEYVKGRKNVYNHPALAAYATQGKLVNETAKLLMQFIREKIADGDELDEFDLF